VKGSIFGRPCETCPTEEQYDCMNIFHIGRY